MAAKFGPDQVILPSGTSDPTGTRPEGEIFFNSADKAFKYSDGNGWKKISAAIVKLQSISGTVFSSRSKTISLAGEGFLSSNLVVTFTPPSGSPVDVTVTPTSDTTASVAVPTAIYNLAGGSSVSVKVRNSDQMDSDSISMSIVGLPTGGTIYEYNGYRVHAFTSSGTLSVPANFPTTGINYLVVAGGGGTSASHRNGGGGAGGVVYASSNIAGNNNYSITVGAGGAVEGYTDQGGDGGNSVAFGTTAIGGGGGGGGANEGYTSLGRSGGSGGGAGNGRVAYSAYNPIPGGSGTAGQGNAGGYSHYVAPYYCGGGGGGAGQAGGNWSNTGSLVPGTGGNGLDYGSTFGTTYGEGGWFGGGGGGGRYNAEGTQGGGGLGGGADTPAAASVGANGQANTGGGGGGTGGAGGSGIVLVRYQI